MRQACPLPPLLLNVVLEFLHRAKREGEIKKKYKQVRNSQTIPIHDDITLYLKDQKNYTSKLLDAINSFSKVAGYKINLQKSVALLYTKNE
jgi:hypothetical protein